MRKPHLLTALLLVLALFLSACDTLNGLLPKGPDPVERHAINYGLGLYCESETRFDVGEAEPYWRSNRNLALYYRMEFQEEIPADPDADTLRDFDRVRPTVKWYAPDGELLKDVMVPVMVEDGLLVTYGHGQHTPTTYEPVIGGTYKVVINDEFEHDIVLEEGTCIDTFEPVTIDFDPVTREWNVTWQDVAPHLGYEARLVTNYGPFYEDVTEPSWTYTMPEPFKDIVTGARLMIRTTIGDSHPNLYNPVQYPEIGVYDYQYGRAEYAHEMDIPPAP